MIRLGRMLQESFLPVLLVLVAILAATLLVDSRAERWARRYTVIRLSPSEGSWDPDQIAEGGAPGSNAGLALQPADDPLIVEARATLERGDAAAAEAQLRQALQQRPADSNLLNELGVLLLRTEKPADAIPVLTQAIEADPGNVRARYHRGLAHGRLGAHEAERADYRAVLDARPRHFESTVNLGLLELDGGDPGAAVELLRRAVGLAGGEARARAYFSLGRALAAADRKDEAFQAYSKAIEFKPGYLLPRFNQAQLLLKGGDHEDRVRAEALLDEITALRPDFAPAYFLRGKIASREGEYQAALGHYETAARYDPRFWKARYNTGIVALRLDRIALAEQLFNRLAADFPGRAEVPFNLGRIAYRREQYERAAELYARALELNAGEYPEASLNLALALRGQGKLEQSLAQLDGMLARTVRPEAVQLNRGLVLERLGRHDDARQAFAMAIEARPGYASAYYNLGKLEADHGAPQRAIQAYRSALQADPRYLKAAVNLGIVLSRSGEHEQAVAAYRRAIAISPTYAPAHFNLALALRERKQLQASAEEYRRVLELDADQLRARQNLGAIYAKLGQYELAIQTFNEVLDRDPSRAKVRYNLALQYKKTGRLDQAEAEFRRVVRLNPEYIRALLSLAGLLRERGLLAEAVTWIEQARALRPKSTNIARRLEQYRAELEGASGGGQQ